MKKITESLKDYDLKETFPVKLLRESSDNKVFVIGDKNKKILRISKRLPVEDVKFEYEVINYLSNSGIAVPKWLHTNTGNFYTKVDGNVAIMFDFLNGHNIKVDKYNLPTTDYAYSAGKGLGFISNISSGFTPSSPRKRNIFSELERAIALSNLFIERFDGGKEFINQAREAIDFGKNSNEVEGLIHNDYRPSNVFFNNNDEFDGIIDFDWSCIGPIIKDLALAIVEWSFPDGAIEPDFKIFDSFLDGYNSVAVHKRSKDKKLYLWIKFATLSDSSTYFCDLIGNNNSNKRRIISSYMYQKYLFFNSLV